MNRQTNATATSAKPPDMTTVRPPATLPPPPDTGKVNHRELQAMVQTAK